MFLDPQHCVQVETCQMETSEYNTHKSGFLNWEKMLFLRLPKSTGCGGDWGFSSTLVYASEP